MVDLQTPMAIEKNEIFSVVELLDNSDDSTELDTPLILDIATKFFGIIPSITSRIFHEDILICLKDRSPPSLI